ncbi:MAG: 2-oxoacid:acceptor oxidoreductase family protein [Firmicutes bacterium]|nr:2-oxoacid:acceptor oxidoreductase family protein [Bacillota bacterium]
MDRFDVRLAGLGGQGLLLAGLIMGEASAVHDGKNAVQTINYAPLARGAPSRAELVISDSPIYFPEVEDADILLAMSQNAYDEFSSRVKPGGIIIIDTDNVTKFEEIPGLLKYPVSTIAKRETGRVLTGSIVGLGIISKVTGKVSADALRKAIRTRAPKGTVELNMKALEAGFII